MERGRLRRACVHVERCGRTDWSGYNNKTRSQSSLLTGKFSEEEQNLTIKDLKHNKASGLDDITTEQIKHFGRGTKNWLFDFFNEIVNTYQIPKIWRKAEIITLL
jgi:hypothetical protein